MTGIILILMICTLFVIPMLRLFYVQLFNFFHAKTTNERFGRMGQFNSQLVLRDSGMASHDPMGTDMTQYQDNLVHDADDEEMERFNNNRSRTGTQVGFGFEKLMNQSTPDLRRQSMQVSLDRTGGYDNIQGQYDRIVKTRASIGLKQ